MTELREQLLGYLLDALDAEERAEVEQILRERPELERELAVLSQMVTPLEAVVVTYEPPEGLVDRTCGFIADSAGWSDSPDFTAPNFDAQRGGEQRRLEARYRELAEEFRSADTSEPDSSTGRASASLLVAEIVPEALVAERQADRHPSPDNSHQAPATTYPTRSGVPREESQVVAELRVGVGSASRWSVADVVMACGVSMLALAVLLPQLVAGRDVARQFSCQQRMANVGGAIGALEQVREVDSSLLAMVPGMIEAPRQLVCPDASGIDLGARRAVPALTSWGTTAPWTVPGQQAMPSLVIQPAGPAVHSASLVSLSAQVVATEAPQATSLKPFPPKGSPHSEPVMPRPPLRHGRRGFNVLFRDGRVEFLALGPMSTRSFESNSK